MSDDDDALAIAAGQMYYGSIAWKSSLEFRLRGQRMTTVGIYVRISPGAKKKRVDQVEKEEKDTVNQERELTIYAAKQDWEIYQIYKDILVTGSRRGDDRKEFHRMMEDARQKKFDLILFWALDRLSREGVRETIQYLKQLEDWGVGYQSYTERYFDSCGIFKDAIIAIMATLAKQERVKLIDRTRAGLETARIKGIKLGRRKKIVDIVVAQDMRNNGFTLKEIAKKFGVSESLICRRTSLCIDHSIQEAHPGVEH